MQENEIIQLMEEVGVIKKGHFKLSSGRHADLYLQCALIQQYPVLHKKVMQGLAEFVKTFQPTLVIGAAVGGIIAAYELASLVHARCIFAERIDGKLTFRRGFEILPEDRVILIEDVITTAKTTLELVELIQQQGHDPLAVVSLVDRRTLSETIPYPFQSAVKIQAVTWEAESCPLCEQQIPIDEPGSRRLKK